MKFVDVHAHMYLLPEMKKELDAKGIAVINCGTNPVTNQEVIDSSYFKSLGWWPLEKGFFDVVRKQVVENNPVAVGEIGLDFYWSETKKKQVVQFKKMLGLAQELGKPVIVHSRRAEKDVVEILEGYDLRVVMHAFTGKNSLVGECVERGYFFSIPGIVVRSEQSQKIVELVPVEQLLTESDSPYLGPVKGERNSPLSIPQVVEKISKIKGEFCEKKLLGNAKSIFF
ncbi:MAG: TatD family hydrolase [Nanoarchaeota archaeon]|nr:TatD family hydrolase [Nanoarchaeota archaeon]